MSSHPILWYVKCNLSGSSVCSGTAQRTGTEGEEMTGKTAQSGSDADPDQRTHSSEQCCPSHGPAGRRSRAGTVGICAVGSSRPVPDTGIGSGVIRESRQPLAGVRTRVLEVDGDGPPLVLLHGFGAAEDAQPGMILPQFEAVAIAAAALARTGSADPVVLVGNSMGGLVSLSVANRRATELAGTVAVCSAGLHHPAWIPLIAARGMRVVLPALTTWPLRSVTREAVPRLLTSVRTDHVAAHVPRYIGHLRPARLAHQLSIVRRLLDEQDYPLQMGAIECPVLFVWGDRDRAAVWRLNGPRLLGLAARSPNSRSEVIPGCGHTPQLEAPDALLALIDGFLPATGRHTRVALSSSRHPRPGGGQLPA